jgi:hypothetical protein
MQIFIISKNSRPDNTGVNEPVAAVLAGVPQGDTYSEEAHTIYTSPGQLPIAAAVREVESLSSGAYHELGLTFDKVAALRRQAEPAVTVSPGDKLYVSIYRGDNGMGYPKIKGVYLTAQDIPLERPTVVEVFATFNDFLAGEQKKAIQKEIAGLSAQTKKMLGVTF